MTDLRKAAEMALEALMQKGEHHPKVYQTAEALRQALAQPEQKYDYRIKYDRPCYKCLSNFCPGNCKESEHLTQPVDTVNMTQQRVDETAKRGHEPVGYIDGMYGGYMVFTPINPSAVYANGTALYTAPPKREWIGLAKEDMPDGDNPMFDTNEFYAGMAWAQTKLKEKNGG